MYALPIPSDIQRIDVEIARYDAMKDRALQVSWVALQVFAAAIAITALFYTSPVIPMILGVAVSFVLIFCLANSSSHTSGLGEVLLFPTLAGGCAGIKLGQVIYTAKVATVVGLTNAAIAIPTLVVAATGGVTVLYANRQTAELQKLREWFHNQEEGGANPPMGSATKFAYLQPQLPS